MKLSHALWGHPRHVAHGGEEISQSPGLGSIRAATEDDGTSQGGITLGTEFRR